MMQLSRIHDVVGTMHNPVGAIVSAHRIHAPRIVRTQRRLSYPAIGNAARCATGAPVKVWPVVPVISTRM